jgi:hypothetical protein
MAAKKNNPKRAARRKKTARAAGAKEVSPKKSKRVSALDAAARVLAEEAKPMSCGELVEAMAAKRYWSSPAGKTPASTLYSAMLREMNTKGTAARFRKTERGKFACRKTA